MKDTYKLKTYIIADQIADLILMDNQDGNYQLISGVLLGQLNSSIFFTKKEYEELKNQAILDSNTGRRIKTEDLKLKKVIITIQN
tara:strand:- start:36648 stop:36902 length:255 start_codon:yes stop_codon:yes gene_type:complete